MKTQSKLVILAFAAILFLLNSCRKELISSSSNYSVSKINVLQDSMVRVPGGLLVPRSHIYMIENGYQLQISNRHVLKVETKTGKLIQDFGVRSTSFNTTDIKLKSNNSRENPTNLQINPLRQTTDFNPSYPGTGGSLINSWQTYSIWNTPSTAPIGYFSTNWTVPNNPTTLNDGQLIYIYDALLPPGGGPAIMQPVLQWGSNGVIGGSYWCITNWYVWNDDNHNSYFAVTNPITVNTGTNLQGIMNLTGSTNDGSQNFTSTFQGYNNAVNITEGNQYSGLNGYKNTYPNNTVTIPFIYPQLGAAEALEVYNSQNVNGGFDVANVANDYPQGGQYIDMNNIKLLLTNNAPANVTWNPVRGGRAYYNEFANIVSNNTSGSGEVKLYYTPPVSNYTFQVTSGDQQAATFNLTVNEINNTSNSWTTAKNQTVNATTSVTAVPNSTVVMNVTSGTMPTSANLVTSQGTIPGYISGSTITFSGVPLNIGTSCEVNLDAYNIPVTVNMTSNPSLHVVNVALTPTTSGYTTGNLNFTSSSTQNFVGTEPSQIYNLQIFTYSQRCHVTVNNNYTQDTQGGHTTANFNNITLYGPLQVSVVPF